VVPYRHIRQQIEARERHFRSALQSPALFVKSVTAATVDLQQPIINRKYLLNINILRIKLNPAGQTPQAGSVRRKFGRICQRFCAPRCCG
jgi:hypothetical protein